MDLSLGEEMACSVSVSIPFESSMAVGSRSRMATLRTTASLPMPRPPGGRRPTSPLVDVNQPVADPSG
ncbi:hypothetical protein B296_00024476 [Ensete ventricosum]|uniref:Uncharacterized protein n=1 Tax=Ensete ventricosum TaxID=4639 RepID=A0A426Z129_ENSVE|nr:hypothetical protein B296_00024476 [Ensete ventricosum]